MCIHEWFQSIYHNLRNDFVCDITKAYGSKLRHLLWNIHLRDEGDESFIKGFEQGA